MNADFSKHFQCDFKPSESDNRLHAIAKQYVDETETYDRSVCTGPIGRDGIMPATPYEFALVNRNAIRVMSRLCSLNPGFTRAQIQRAASRTEYRGQPA